MAMTLQPMKWHHRPLIAYVVIGVIPLAALHLFLRAALGLRRHTLADGHAYWHRPGRRDGTAAETGPARLPLLFFHGVGGLGLYAALVWRLARARAGPLLLVEIPHVGLTLQSFEALGPVSGVSLTYIYIYDATFPFPFLRTSRRRWWPWWRVSARGTVSRGRA